MRPTKLFLLNIFDKLPVIPVASCFTINRTFLVQKTAQFDETINVLFFVYKNFGFSLSVFPVHCK